MFCWKTHAHSMTSPTKVLLLACGSFNPVTNMHLRMFEIARDAMIKNGRFQVMGGIMSPVSDGYKKKDLVSAKHRCAMLKAALKTSDWIKLDSWECEQTSWLPTAKVLRHHRELVETQHCSNYRPSPSKRRKKQQHNIVADIPQNQIPSIAIEGDGLPVVKLLCGADLLESFAVPGLWTDEDIDYIVGSHGLVVISRSDSDPLKFIYESDILTKYQENILIVTEWIYNDISSTKVRRALRRGDSVKYVVQDSVIDYIREHQLYGVPDNKYFNHMMPSPNEVVSPEVEEDESSSSSGEISVVLRSSQQGVTPSNHIPFHRMSTLTEKRMPSPKSTTEHSSSRVPCISDIGMLVKRVKNYDLRSTLGKRASKIENVLSRPKGLSRKSFR